MGHREQGPRTVNVAVLTVSDTRTEATDTSGALIRDLCVAAGHRVTHYRLTPDDPDQVRAALADLVSRADVEAVMINGGTGISKRDRTFEAIATLLQRRIDGFGELFRSLSYQEIGAAAMMSRATGGLIGDRPVFSMPGSTAAVRLAMEKLILPELGHAVSEAQKPS